MLRYVEIESAIHKALLVLKIRGSDHAKDIRQFEITNHGIEISPGSRAGRYHERQPTADGGSFRAGVQAPRVVSR